MIAAICASFPIQTYVDKIPGRDEVNEWFQTNKDKIFAWTALICKSIVSSYSAFYFGGMFLGATAAVAFAMLPPLFYLLTRFDKSWLDTENLSEKFKTTLKTIPKHYCAAIVVVIVVASLEALFIGNVIKAEQTLHKEFVEYCYTNDECIELFYQICVKAPILEEILFRGFIYDGLHYLMSEENKIARIGLQAISFGALHYIGANQGNHLIVAMASVGGATFGYLRENRQYRLSDFDALRDKYFGNICNVNNLRRIFMSTLVTTILIGFGFFTLALALLGISWIITGKLRIKPGACGRAPQQKRNKNCGKDVKCTLCENNDEEDKDDNVQ